MSIKFVLLSAPIAISSFIINGSQLLCTSPARPRTDTRQPDHFHAFSGQLVDELQHFLRLRWAVDDQQIEVVGKSRRISVSADAI